MIRVGGNPPLTNAACTIYPFWYRILPHEQYILKRATCPLFFTGPTIGVSDENVSPPTTGHQQGQKWSRVSVGKTCFPFLAERGGCGCFKACPYVKGLRKHSPAYNSMVNFKCNITQKPNPTLEPSIYKQLPKIRMFSAQKSICPRRFERDGPEHLNTCTTCTPIPRPYLRGVLFTFDGHISSYAVRTYTCIYVSKKSAES